MGVNTVLLTSKNLDLTSGWTHLRPDRNAGSNFVVNSETANEGSLQWTQG